MAKQILAFLLKADSMSDVTRILFAIEQGDPSASEKLLPLVYDELRKLAARWTSQENPGQTLQATALVHEAYIRLVDVAQAKHWDSRGHFFSAAAEAMRRILVESARRRDSLKRGGEFQRVELNDFAVASAARSEDVLALNEALEKLNNVDPRAAELVKLRYFAGLTLKDAADCLGIAPRTADGLWAYGRAFLFDAIR